MAAFVYLAIALVAVFRARPDSTVETPGEGGTEPSMLTR